MDVGKKLSMIRVDPAKISPPPMSAPGRDPLHIQLGQDWQAFQLTLHKGVTPQDVGGPFPSMALDQKVAAWLREAVGSGRMSPEVRAFELVKWLGNEAEISGLAEKPPGLAAGKGWSVEIENATIGWKQRLDVGADGRFRATIPAVPGDHLTMRSLGPDGNRTALNALPRAPDT